MLLYDFKCGECGHEQESFVPNSGVKTQVCNGCAGITTRRLTAPSFHLDGTDPGFPGAYSKWADQHEKAGNQ